MPHSTPIDGFLARIEALDDTDLIEVLYGDFVRRVFQGYRVTVTPGRPTPGATSTPQLVNLPDTDGRYGRARLYDNLVVVSGPPGSLGEEHLRWLFQLRKGVQARVDALKAALDTDPFTGLGSERRFHAFVGALPRKERWLGWLMCLTMVPEEGTTPAMDDVEGIFHQVADVLRRHHPDGAQLYRLNNGFFAGLVKDASAEDGERLVKSFQNEIAGLHPPGISSLSCMVGIAPLGTGKRVSVAFYQKLIEALRACSGQRLTLSDLNRARPKKPEPNPPRGRRRLS